MYSNCNAQQEGIVMKRWHQIAVIMMLEKDPGSPIINWLQIIRLYEAVNNLVVQQKY